MHIWSFQFHIKSQKKKKKNGEYQSISTICHENRKLLKPQNVLTERIVMTMSSNKTASIHCHQKCSKNKA